MQKLSQNDSPTGPAAGGSASPARGPVEETAKTRAERVRLAYLPRGNLFWRILQLPLIVFRRDPSGDRVSLLRDSLTCWAVLLSAAAGLVVIVAEVVGALGGSPPQTSFVRRVVHGTASPGELAGAHAFLEYNCQACHARSHPIQGGHWSATAFGLDDLASKARCQQCHAGPKHHTNEVPDLHLACANCHVDHRGREHRLARVDEAQCLRCHRQLADHMVKKPKDDSLARLRISGFTVREHPEFAAVAKPSLDPGKLKFNHRVHLALGMGKTPTTGFYKYGDIRDGQQRTRYMGMNPDKQAGEDSLVQLDCQACHQLDRQDYLDQFGDGKNEPARMEEMKRHLATTLPPRAAGANYLPIVYEHHCQACHALDVPKRPTEDLVKLHLERPAHGERNTASIETVPVRHGLQPVEFDDFLASVFLGDGGRGKKPFDLPAPRTSGATDEPLIDAARDALENDIRLTRQILFLGEQTCTKCHNLLEPMTDKGRKTIDLADMDAVIAALAANDFLVEPPNITDLWFPKARFDHAAHRAVDCQQCHVGVRESEFTSDALLPGIQTCVQCHAPLRYVAGKPHGGVRHACTNCHAYHHADKPLAGPGAKAFGAQLPKSTADFLEGRRGGASSR